MKNFFVMSFYLYVIGCFIIVDESEGSDKGFGKSDIDRVCAKTRHKPAPRVQFDGKKANIEVMRLQPGKYNYPNQGALLLFANAHYLIKLPQNRDGIHGTDGNDLLASGGIVGGCSKEQLSEAMQNNKLQVSSFKLIKIYK